jgi:hypothetical protein
MFPDFPVPHSPPRKSIPPVVLWVAWFGITSAIPLYQIFLGGGWPRGSNVGGAGLSAIELMAVGQLLAATVIRWLVLPRFSQGPQLLTLMIVGLALSEAVELYGVLLIPRDQPETKISLFVLSLLSAAQFAPTYARSQPAVSMR